MKAEREMDAHLPFCFKQKPPREQTKLEKKTIEKRRTRADDLIRF